MVVFKCYFSIENIAFSFSKRCEHEINNINNENNKLKNVHPVAVTGSPNLLCCILRYFIDFAFCCCVI